MFYFVHRCKNTARHTFLFFSMNRYFLFSLAYRHFRPHRRHSTARINFLFVFALLQFTKHPLPVTTFISAISIHDSCRCADISIPVSYFTLLIPVEILLVVYVKLKFSSSFCYCFISSSLCDIMCFTLGFLILRINVIKVQITGTCYEPR